MNYVRRLGRRMSGKMGGVVARAGRILFGKSRAGVPGFANNGINWEASLGLVQIIPV
jgi:hypothetical protein